MRYETFFRERVGVDDNGLVRQLSDNASARALRKGELVLGEGQPQEEVSFLASGVARSYAVDAEGHEVTDCLVDEPGLALSPSADLGEPAVSNVEMLVEGTVVSVPTALIVDLLQTSLPANHLYIRMLSRAWREHWEVRRAVSQLRARDRYVWFVGRHPDLVERVPNKYVASLLGMTPVTLSRLRSELRDEGLA